MKHFASQEKFYAKFIDNKDLVVNQGDITCQNI